MASDWLVLAVGNPSRGDDALGPALLDRLRLGALGTAGDVELLLDFQLQVEHALDLAGRRAVLFVDAARPGAGVGVAIRPIHADGRVAPASHALTAQAVLSVAQRVAPPPPPAWQLGIEGESFELGQALSACARANLAIAESLALEWLKQRRAARDR